MNTLYLPRLEQDKILDTYGQKILKQLQEFLRSMSEEGRKLLSEKLEIIAKESVISIDEEEQSIADLISGKTYSEEERKELDVINLINSFSLRAKLLENTITSSKVADLLGCSSRQTPLDRVKNQTLIAVKDNGKWKYPLWQFDAEGPDGVIQGLPKVIAVLQVSNLGKVSWLTLGNPVFNNKTPLDMLKEGRIEEVLNEAMGVGTAQ